MNILSQIYQWVLAHIDFVNGFFEAGGAIFIASNVIKLHRDKAVKGVWVWSVIFFAVWGMWNLLFYPLQDLWFSFIAGCFVMIFNLIWIVQMVYYSRNKGVVYIQLSDVSWIRKHDILNINSQDRIEVLKVFPSKNKLKVRPYNLWEQKKMKPWSEKKLIETMKAVIKTTSKEEITEELIKNINSSNSDIKASRADEKL